MTHTSSSKNLKFVIKTKIHFIIFKTLISALRSMYDVIKIFAINKSL